MLAHGQRAYKFSNCPFKNKISFGRLPPPSLAENRGRPLRFVVRSRTSLLIPIVHLMHTRFLATLHLCSFLLLLFICPSSHASCLCATLHRPNAKSLLPPPGSVLLWRRFIESCESDKGSVAHMQRVNINQAQAQRKGVKESAN